MLCHLYGFSVSCVLGLDLHAGCYGQPEPVPNGKFFCSPSPPAQSANWGATLTR